MGKKYYKLPAALLTYNLTPRAQILYAVLADRQQLSKGKAEFTDKTGNYIIYKREDICTLLGIGKRTADYAIAELEDAGLLIRKQQGRNMPVKIYVQEVKGSAKNCAADSAKNCAADSAKNCAHNYTDNNYTDIISSSERGLVRLISVIDKVAAKDNITLSDDQVYKLLKKIRKQGDKIGNLEGWIRTAVRNIIMLPDSDPDAEGYPPTYDIEEYESQSITDGNW